MRDIIKTILLLTLWTLTAAVQAGGDISQQDVLKLIEAKSTNVLLLDVRSEKEYAEGRVPGSINVPVKQVLARAEELKSVIAEKQIDKVVVYCAAGPRAYAARAALEAKGIAGILHLDGDMNGWRKANYPVEK